MINNIKFNIFNKILRKIILAYYYFKFVINYDFDFYLKLQKNKYNELDLNRSIGINKLKDLNEQNKCRLNETKEEEAKKF